jgi:hypothetical protein
MPQIIDRLNLWKNLINIDMLMQHLHEISKQLGRRVIFGLAWAQESSVNGPKPK